VLLSNVLFFGFLAFTRLGRLFFESASSVQSRASVWGQWDWFRSTRREADDRGRGVVERLIAQSPWPASDVRALIIKDARTFWRDTTQWGQSVMLFGLLGVYIINLRHFSYQLSSPFWVNLVSYLNLGACALNLATVTTRFVFPQFSLEGRRLWIVGLAPMGLERVVKTKYWLASCSSLSVTLSLVLLSSWLLKMSWDRILFFGAAVAVMSFALNGLAVGLGVLYPNFKEANPSKIVSGFGGTLCLVLSFLYILASVCLLALGAASPQRHSDLMLAGLSGFLALSLMIGLVPFKLGLSYLKRF
jgi:ABC-2 type transport system permease protein